VSRTSAKQLTKSCQSLDHVIRWQVCLHTIEQSACHGIDDVHHRQLVRGCHTEHVNTYLDRHRCKPSEHKKPCKRRWKYYGKEQDIAFRPVTCAAAARTRTASTKFSVVCFEGSKEHGTRKGVHVFGIRAKALTDALTTWQTLSPCAEAKGPRKELYVIS
jgi:hypothetical protein